MDQTSSAGPSRSLLISISRYEYESKLWRENARSRALRRAADEVLLKRIKFAMEVSYFFSLWL